MEEDTANNSDRFENIVSQITKTYRDLKLPEEALRVTPGLKDATLQEIRVGLRPVPVDELPIILVRW